MSPMTLTLTVANGPLAGQAYELREPAVYVMGRAAECYPRLPDQMPYKDISRLHCLLSVDPCELRLLDLGSTNGTFVNGARLRQAGGAGPAPAGEPGAVTLSLRAQTMGWHVLKDGDVIALGDHTVLRVAVQVGQPVEA
jgi:pSer/pThr/pTyr-binding forkhead associated (FHA) protein